MNLSDSSPNLSSPVPQSSPASEVKILVHAMAASVLILCGTLFVFLYRQVVLVRRQTAEVVRFLMEYRNSNARQYIDEAHRELANFSQDHPDFRPIYTRYFGNTPPPPEPGKTNRAPALPTSSEGKITAIPASTNR